MGIFNVLNSVLGVTRYQHSAVNDTIDMKPVYKEYTELCHVLCLFLVEAWKTNSEA